MNIVKALGLILTLGGLAALIYAVVEIFDSASGGLTKGSTWAALVLGVIVFYGGIRLLTSAGGK